MEFREVLRRRRMVRNFSDTAISPDVLERILQAGLRAPSAGFTQGWDFLVLEGRDQTERFWEATFEPGAREGFRWPGLFRAPVIIVVVASMDAYLDRYAEPDKGWADRDPGRWPVPYWYVDAGFASLLMLLAAVDEGLGALFFGIFRPDAFRAAFAVPQTHSPVGAVALGYPEPDEPSTSLRRGRRDVDEVLHRGTW